MQTSIKVIFITYSIVLCGESYESNRYNLSSVFQANITESEFYNLDCKPHGDNNESDFYNDCKPHGGNNESVFTIQRIMLSFVHCYIKMKCIPIADTAIRV